MKKLYTTILLAAFSLSLTFGQQVNIAFGSGGVQGLPDSAALGQVLDISFHLVNQGPDTIHNEILIRYAVDTVDFPQDYEIVATSGQVSDWVPGDSMYFSFRDTVDAPSYIVGDNVTIVWPTSILSYPGTIEYHRGDMAVSELQAIGLNEWEDEIGLYPNPATSVINLKAPFGLDWVLIDGLGQRVAEGSENQINLLGLPAGVYFIQVKKQGQEQLATFRFIRN